VRFTARRSSALIAVLLVLPPSQAAAQNALAGRAAIEAVASIATSSADGIDDPFVVFDVASTFRVTDGLDAIVRPYARRLPGGDWDAVFYQAQIRYQPAERVRIDAGIITSPMGLGTFELRPDLNPLVGYPFYYFGRLPAFDEYNNRVQILSGGYPLGAVVSVSGAKWDARAGVTDSTPARYRKIFAESSPSPMAQVIAGGGITPWTGFRVGGAIAKGKYRSSSDSEYYGLPDGYMSTLTDADALVMNLEAEWSYRYTKISGELVRDRFETNGSPAVSRGFYVQGVQTLTPRTFAAGRYTYATTPTAALTRLTRESAEFSGGYRLIPALTLRAGYEGSRRFGATDWNHAAVASIVWAQRWF
jgi:hypothetical protein